MLFIPDKMHVQFCVIVHASIEEGGKMARALHIYYSLKYMTRSMTYRYIPQDTCVITLLMNKHVSCEFKQVRASSKKLRFD